MRLFLLSDPGCSHTVKWARSLADAGVQVLLFGLGRYAGDHYVNHPRIEVRTLEVDTSREEGAWAKLGYLKALSRVRRLIREFDPDIVHAHYASSYGLLGALAGFSPFILSVWGSDVFSFPKKSPLHRKILEFNLARADKVLSTSHVMARETRLYTPGPVTVTPFGIDLGRFRPGAGESPFLPDDIVVGTVKTLDDKYGVEYAIRAFALVCENNPALPLRLLIVGDGPQKSELKELCARLGVNERTVFTGRVSYDDVVRYHNMLSVSVFVSKAESFGVAVLEAGACERPVIVSRVGGLPEVVEDGVTGLIVPPEDPSATARAMERLILDPRLRAAMGVAGRQRVERMYDWQACVRQMLDIYSEVGNG